MVERSHCTHRDRDRDRDTQTHRRTDTQTHITGVYVKLTMLSCSPENDQTPKKQIQSAKDETRPSAAPRMKKI